jgi:nucleoid-associated protein YgaU
MTSDAKIGLLLGLVFIFVIAFVINGLPSLRPQTGKAGVTTNLPPNEEFTDVTRETDKAVNWSDLLEQQRTGGETVQTAVEAPKPAVPEPPQQAEPRTAKDEKIRSILPLPDLGPLLERLTPTIPTDRTAADNLNTLGSVTEQLNVSGRQPVAVAPQPKSEPPSEPKPGETLTKGTDTGEPPKPVTAPNKPATLPAGKVYTVVDGDNLAVIAKKMYGPEEGNRVVNIQRIFHANLVVLKSPDDVLVGQKLIIPPLAKPAPAPTAVKPDEVLPKTLFEKVESLKRPIAAAPAATAEDRSYTVQNGDSLWKIAASQLGNGARWDDIAKLNADILTKSKDSLSVGMRLRLPAK